MSFRPKSPAVPPSGEVTEGAASAIAAPISGDELAARLFAEQGYLVHPFLGPRKIGEVFRSGPVSPDDLTVRTPFRIVGKATKEELLSQRKLALKWRVHGIALNTQGTHFYRVVAAD